VNDTGETVTTQNASVIACRRRFHRTSGLRRRERQRSMRSVPVVVIHEHLEDPLTVRLVQHEDPLETFRAHRPDKPLRNSVGLWRAIGEFLIPITNQKPDRFRTVRQGPRHLPRLLDDPLGTRIRRAPGQVHAAAAQLDEEEDVESCSQKAI
jgi:hypothetical protein